MERDASVGPVQSSEADPTGRQVCADGVLQTHSADSGTQRSKRLHVKATLLGEKVTSPG